MTQHVDTEQMMHAACINRDAAAEMQHAAGTIIEAVRDLRAMIEPGYGNQFSEMLEILRAGLEKETKP